jgi:DNA-binding HxlR family transcriptional regulator
MSLEVEAIEGLADGGAVDLSSARECPVESAIAAIAGKWKLSILRALFLEGPLRYNQLLAAVSGLNAKELTRNLRELEYAGLVVAGPNYDLTEMGVSLQPVFQSLGKFGEQLRKARTNS